MGCTYFFTVLYWHAYKDLFDMEIIFTHSDFPAKVVVFYFFFIFLSFISHYIDIKPRLTESEVFCPLKHFIYLFFYIYIFSVFSTLISLNKLYISHCFIFIHHIKYFPNQGHKFFKCKTEQIVSFKDNNDKENETEKKPLIIHYLFTCFLTPGTAGEKTGLIRH